MITIPIYNALMKKGFLTIERKKKPNLRGVIEKTASKLCLARNSIATQSERGQKHKNESQSDRNTGDI